jgi:hypothetical protein
MKGFLLGLLVAGMAAGGYLYWKERLAAKAPAPSVADAGAPIKEAKEKRKRRRRGATRLARASELASAGGEAAPERGHDRERPRREPAAPPAPSPPMEADPEPIKLSAGDLKLVSQGDDLSRPDVIRMDMTDDSGSHELSQDEIDGRFRAKEEAILSCISRARPDEETYVPGRVTVKFRIQRSGNVRGVRVEAPSILQKGGLYGCIKGVVGGIRFAPSNGSQVVSYPFSLT